MSLQLINQAINKKFLSLDEILSLIDVETKNFLNQFIDNKYNKLVI